MQYLLVGLCILETDKRFQRSISTHSKEQIQPGTLRPSKFIPYVLRLTPETSNSFTWNVAHAAYYAL